jgi:hypothetical protein
MNKIKLKITEGKNYIKIISVGDEFHNEGLITMTKKKPVWLSLAKKREGIKYLTGEIEKAGGDFINELGFKKSKDGKAICGTGSSYCGGVPFKDIDAAIKYLSVYFDVSWWEPKEELKTDRTAKIIKSNGASATPLTAVNDPESLEQHSWSSTIKDSGALVSIWKENDINSFGKFYVKLSDIFHSCKRLVTILGELTYKSSSWPNLPGVYVVRRKNKTRETQSIEHENIIYIGMTGKLSSHGYAIPGRLSTRPSRWDPYSFTKSNFLYGYNRATKEYDFEIPVNDLLIDCFIFDGSGTAAPTFFESLILQSYAFCSSYGSNRLPPANNAF